MNTCISPGRLDGLSAVECMHKSAVWCDPTTKIGILIPVVVVGPSKVLETLMNGYETVDQEQILYFQGLWYYNHLVPEQEHHVFGTREAQQTIERISGSITINKGGGLDCRAKMASLQPVAAQFPMPQPSTS